MPKTHVCPCCGKLVILVSWKSSKTDAWWDIMTCPVTGKKRIRTNETIGWKSSDFWAEKADKQLTGTIL